MTPTDWRKKYKKCWQENRDLNNHISERQNEHMMEMRQLRRDALRAMDILQSVVDRCDNAYSAFKEEPADYYEAEEEVAVNEHGEQKVIDLDGEEEEERETRSASAAAPEERPSRTSDASQENESRQPNRLASQGGPPERPFWNRSMRSATIIDQGTQVNHDIASPATAQESIILMATALPQAPATGSRPDVILRPTHGEKRLPRKEPVVDQSSPVLSSPSANQGVRRTSEADASSSASKAPPAVEGNHGSGRSSASGSLQESSLVQGKTEITGGNFSDVRQQGSAPQRGRGHGDLSHGTFPSQGPQPLPSSRSFANSSPQIPRGRTQFDDPRNGLVFSMLQPPGRPGLPQSAQAQQTSPRLPTIRASPPFPAASPATSQMNSAYGNQGQSPSSYTPQNNIQNFAFSLPMPDSRGALPGSLLYNPENSSYQLSSGQGQSPPSMNPPSFRANLPQEQFQTPRRPQMSRNTSTTQTSPKPNAALAAENLRRTYGAQGQRSSSAATSRRNRQHFSPPIPDRQGPLPGSRYLFNGPTEARHFPPAALESLINSRPVVPPSERQPVTPAKRKKKPANIQLSNKRNSSTEVTPRSGQLSGDQDCERSSPTYSPTA